MLGRFELDRVLGEGGMGIVYAARDRERSVEVALKTLRQLDPRSLLRFKSEFRSLTSVAHRNLVSLLELLSDGDQWFFTMELVDGPDLLSWVRGSEASPPISADVTFTIAGPKHEGPPPRSGPMVTAGTNPQFTRKAPTYDPDRLRLGMLELVDAVETLHSAGYLHRDLKPSNILVSSEPRVVVMDFGILTALSDGGMSRDMNVVGTPAYMAPEQARGEIGGGASDWYSVGVILYQILTASVPFRGDMAQVLDLKQRLDPPHPCRMFPKVPAELGDLCMRLLARDPAARAGGNDIRQTIDRRRAPRPSRALPAVAPGLIGREQAWEALDAAFARSDHSTTVAIVRGESGMGKSLLLKEFARQAAEQGALTFHGRCYEKESVPYKAVDELVDSVLRHLLDLDPRERKRLIPPGFAALVRVFPVLGQVPEAAGLRIPVMADEHALRTDAFVAFAALIRAMAAGQRVIMMIDDLQWADSDSVAVFRELLAASRGGLLVVLSHRGGADRPIKFLERLRSQLPLPADAYAEIELERLSAEASRRLASVLVDGSLGGEQPLAIEEAEGNPFFLLELARFARNGGAVEGPITLGKVFEERIRGLPPAARRVMELVSLSTQPLPQSVIWRAADVGVDDRAALCEVLRAAHLVQLEGARSVDFIWTYHTRVSEAMRAAIDAESLPRLHGRLAEAMVACGCSEPELLSTHYAAAGDGVMAGRFALRAAERAKASLAFDHAAALFARAVEVTSWSDAELAHIHVSAAECLANSGRAPEAANEFLRAAEASPEADRLDLKRRAAEQWVRSGHFEEGRALIRELLTLSGEPYYENATVSLGLWLMRRLSLRFRSVRLKPQSPGPDPSELARMDTLFAASTGMSHNDPVLGAELISRYTITAIRIGEPDRLARALSMEATYQAASGESMRARTDLLNEQAYSMAVQNGAPDVIAHVTVCRAITSMLRGEWARARMECEQAEAILREHVKGNHWERTTVQLYLLSSLFYLGELGILTSMVPKRLREAEEKGNLYAASALRSWRTNVVWLAEDQPEEARRQVAIADAAWGRHKVKLQEYYTVTSLGRADLYCGVPEAALERMEQAWPRLGRTMMLRVQNVRIECLHHRARYRLAVAAARGAPDLLAAAAKDAARIAREEVGWGRAMSELVMAGVWHQRGERDRAIAAAYAAEAAYRAADMRLYAAVARVRGAELRGADATAALHEVCAAGVRRPERFVAMLAPGFSAPK